MRYEKGHKDATRRRILDVAGERFRSEGLAGAGVAGLMADAGLTNGAFYAHFSSKEDLVREVLVDALEKRRETLADKFESRGIEAALRDYLSPGHRDNLRRGCPTAALVGELARHPKATRQVFGGKVAEIIERLAALLPGDAQQARKTASALYTLMVGTLQVARAVGDKALSDEILAGGLDAALRLAGVAR